MSYGLHLYRQDERGPAEADRRAVRDALARWGWDGSDGNPYRVATLGGITAEFYAPGLDGREPFFGGNLEVHALDAELCRLVLDLARAGRFTIAHDGDPSAVILADEALRTSLPAEMVDDPNLMVCPTPGALEAAIHGGYGAWQEFRYGACDVRPADGHA